MKNLRLPSLFEATSPAQFFAELVALNRDRRGFTQRALARKLGWPVSYLPDLLRGRKKLTLERATQFARVFRLDPISLEKLILLSVVDQGYLAPAAAQEIRERKSPRKKAATSDESLLNAYVFLALEAIRWLKSGATRANVIAILQARGVTPLEAESAIDFLVKKKLVENRAGRLHPRPAAMFSDDDGQIDDGALHAQFADLSKAYFRDRFGPAFYSSAFVHLRADRFGEVCERLTALRNWIFELSTEDAELPAGEDVRLFQLDFNLLPLVRKAEVPKLRR